MLNGRNPEALVELKAYPEETQEFYLQILPMLTILAKTPISKLSAPDIAMMNDLLFRLRETLRPRSELLISRMVCCKKAWGFGKFEALPESHAFLNATKDRTGELVQLYVELKNFACVKGDDGNYLTKLSCSVELTDSNNNKVGSFPFDRKQTTYRAERCLNDYYETFSFCVPPIPVGTYKLTLQITDLTVPNQYRVARKSLDFRVTPVS